MTRSRNQGSAPDDSSLALGSPPDDDGWRLLYRLYHRWAGPVPVLRALVRWYFLPRPFEVWNRGVIYRFLGVAAFGRLIPTGGVVIRRLTGRRMAGYSLRRPTLASARSYLFRTCGFEAAHLMVFMAMSVVVVIGWILGKRGLAVGGAVANVLVNVYPMMLQRYTRVRILALLARSAR